MDGALALTPDEIKGRNMWIVWTGGNDRFWDALTTTRSVRSICSRRCLSHPEPEEQSRQPLVLSGPDQRALLSRRLRGPIRSAFGLWLDQRRSDCPADPFADAEKYPGVAIGARGKNLPVGSYYGEPTGIVGLRLFPNPAFDEAAAKKWDPVRYYTDPDYYNDKDLVEPYRVGMSCGFCHVGPSPVKPPADPENPEMGEHQRDRWLPVLLDRPDLRLGG